MNPYTIFVVEDDPWYGRMLEHHLQLNPEYHVFRFATAGDCLAQLKQRPDLITLDYTLPDMPGDRLLGLIREILPDVPIIVISGQEDVLTAVSLLKLGATDYLIKDDAAKELLWNTILRIRENQQLRQEVRSLREELAEKFTFKKTLIGESPALRQLYPLIEKATAIDMNVFLSGETGTGKEVVAQAIHYNSARCKKPFIAVNMAAIPAELAESELFGHEKGAFTGAETRLAGKFEQAQGGTIFLDEIAELSYPLQAKLLRVLQERELVRLGGHEKIKLDVRLIAASHVKMPELVKAKHFREDLYYRLIGLPLHLPPLRERGKDVLILAEHFLSEFSRQHKLRRFRLSTEAQKRLLQYDFPGNIRELKAVVELALVLCDQGEILPEHILLQEQEFTWVNHDDRKQLKDYIREIVQYHYDRQGHDIKATSHQLNIGVSTIYKMLQDGELKNN